VGNTSFAHKLLERRRKGGKRRLRGREVTLAKSTAGWVKRAFLTRRKRHRISHTSSHEKKKRGSEKGAATRPTLSTKQHQKKKGVENSVP